MAELRISMVQMPDDLKESTAFFEQILRETYGESRFRKAVQIVEEFPGDLYTEKNERKLVERLVRDTITSESEAQLLLH